MTVFLKNMTAFLKKATAFKKKRGLFQSVIQSEAKNLDCVMWALQRSFVLNDKLKDDRVFFKRGRLF